jgi:hypothetical protein
MPNRRKDDRNTRIIRLYANGEGMLQKEIALLFGMKESAVSMVIARDRKRRAEQEKEVQG